MGNCVARPSSRGDVVLVAPARATSLARDADADARAGRSAKKKRETIPLSPIDNALGVRTLVVHWAFMYRGRLPAARVKAALADALDSYPILAGRARKTRASRGRVALELEVVLDDAGVLFETATDDALGLDDLRGTENAGVVQGRDNETPPTFFARVDSRPERGNPLMSVRLTTLGDERRGGGCVLGVSWSHAVADGDAMSAFVAVWAAASRRLRNVCDAPATAYMRHDPAILDYGVETAAPSLPPNPEHPALYTAPSHDRLAVLRDAPDIGEAPFPELRLEDDPRLASGCAVARSLAGMAYDLKFARLTQQLVHVTADEIKSMKTFLAAETRRAEADAPADSASDSTSRAFVTANDAIAVFSWTLTRALRDDEEKRTKKKRGKTRAARDGAFALHAMNLRGQGIPGLGKNLFGNASIFVAARMPPTRANADADANAPDGGVVASFDHGAMARAVRAAVVDAKCVGDVDAQDVRRARVLALSNAGGGAHLRAAVAAVEHADLKHSSWTQFPFWDVRFGSDAGDPAWFWGSVYPQSPWTSCVVADGKKRLNDKPDAVGAYVYVTIPKSCEGMLKARAREVIAALSGA